jgi:anthranilate synthase/aminodeoxychorismate synthase-like glutamine amidotransferase
MIVLVDNYDSFVFNIARYLQELGQAIDVVRNDRIDAETLLGRAPKAVVVSPGPAGPEQAGASNAIVRKLSGAIPILGVCLGCQCIGAVFGGRVTAARHPMHGRASLIVHNKTRLFANLPNPLRVGRYHSLIVEFEANSTSPLEVTARSEEGEVMALAHRHAPTYGVQFHPESILTQSGHALLANFLDLADAWRRRSPNSPPLTR